MDEEQEKRLNRAAWRVIYATRDLLWILVRTVFEHTIFNPITAAVMLLILGMVVIRYGFFTVYPVEQRTWEQFVTDLYANGGAELLSIAITVLIIDRLHRRRAIRERKAELILQMGSPDNNVALEAVRLLRLKGWLRDGTLKWASLSGAKLQGADLVGANLEKARLHKANLAGAYLSGVNLAEANLGSATLNGANLVRANLTNTNFEGAYLENATLPDGSKYTANTDLTHFTGPDVELYHAPSGLTPEPDSSTTPDDPILEDRLVALEREMKLLRAAQRATRPKARRRTNGLR